jgi:hypothetical protein
VNVAPTSLGLPKAASSGRQRLAVAPGPSEAPAAAKPATPRKPRAQVLRMLCKRCAVNAGSAPGQKLKALDNNRIRFPGFRAQSVRSDRHDHPGPAAGPGRVQRASAPRGPGRLGDLCPRVRSRGGCRRGRPAVPPSRTCPAVHLIRP